MTGASPDIVEPAHLEGPALFDTGAWTWVRDRRFPQLASWFNAQVAADRVLMCDVVAMELLRMTPNAQRAREVAERLDALPQMRMDASIWPRARELQALLAAGGDHRRVPPIDLLIAAAAEGAGVPLVHYDRDYARIAAVGALDQRWLVAEGSLA